MPIMRPPSNQRHVTYKRREVGIYHPIENKLMEEHGLTYSDLCKKGIKSLWNERQNKKALTI